MSKLILPPNPALILQEKKAQEFLGRVLAKLNQAQVPVARLNFDKKTKTVTATLPYQIHAILEETDLLDDIASAKAAEAIIKHYSEAVNPLPLPANESEETHH